MVVYVYDRLHDRHSNNKHRSNPEIRLICNRQAQFRFSRRLRVIALSNERVNRGYYRWRATRSGYTTAVALVINSLGRAQLGGHCS